MIDFEERLRSGLRSASERRPAPTGLAQRLEDRIHRRERRARAQRVAAAGVIVVFALAAGVLAFVGSAGDRGVTSLANSTPRNGAAGWMTIPDAPITARYQHTAVNIDGEVLVYGGYRGDDAASGAAIYEPASGRWRAVANPPGDMSSAVAVWTGAVVLTLDTDGRLYSYDPEDDHWAELARSPLGSSSNAVTAVAWTGEILLGVQTFGGDPSAPAPHPVSYDPATDEWTEYEDDAAVLTSFSDAVWTGDELVVVGASRGSGSTFPTLKVRAYSPGEGWAEIPTPPLARPMARTLGYSVWTGSELVTGGGMTWSDEAVQLSAELARENRDPTPEERRVLEPSPALDAAAWNPQTGTWRQLPAAPTPTTGLDRYADVWTGTEVVTWEMDSADAHHSTGRLVLLDPSTGTWRISASPPFGYHQESPATWTGHEIVVFSGEPTSSDTEPSECCTPAPVGVSFTP